jgi:hypothetical protein
MDKKDMYNEFWNKSNTTAVTSKLALVYTTTIAVVISLKEFPKTVAAIEYKINIHVII